jgi:hypothetical protein
MGPHTGFAECDVLCAGSAPVNSLAVKVSRSLFNPIAASMCANVIVNWRLRPTEAGVWVRIYVNDRGILRRCTCLIAGKRRYTYVIESVRTSGGVNFAPLQPVGRVS